MIPGFAIRKADESLIRAAIHLGDWLLRQDQMSSEEVHVIHTLQAALRGLPDAPPELSVGYGVTLRNFLDGSKLHRSWSVSIRDDVLEIFSIYTPEPRENIWEEINSELAFELKAGSENNNETEGHATWRVEISDLDALSAKANEIEVEFELCEYSVPFRAWSRFLSPR